MALNIYLDLRLNLDHNIDINLRINQHLNQDLNMDLYLDCNSDPKRGINIHVTKPVGTGTKTLGPNRCCAHVDGSCN